MKILSMLYGSNMLTIAAIAPSGPPTKSFSTAIFRHCEELLLLLRNFIPSIEPLSLLPPNLNTLILPYHYLSASSQTSKSPSKHSLTPQSESTSLRGSTSRVTTNLDLYTSTPYNMEETSCYILPKSTPQAQVNGVAESEEAIGSASPRPIIDSAIESPSAQAQGSLNILRRSLQVPARGETLLLGFKIPALLTSAGVSKEQWHIFTKEVRDLIDPHWKREWAVYLTLGFGMMLNPGTFVPLTYLIRARQKERDRRRFDDMDADGELKQLTSRWNLVYFEPLGLHVKVDAPNSPLLPRPGSGSTTDMDVASTKLFRYHQKLGAADHAELDHKVNWRKETRYRAKEPKERAIAAKRFSIMVWPLSLIPLETRTPQQPQV